MLTELDTNARLNMLIGGLNVWPDKVSGMEFLVFYPAFLLSPLEDYYLLE